MKKILILYVNNGDIRNVSKVELMWTKVMQWLQEKEQKEIEKIKHGRNERIAIFTDGTTVEVIPVGKQIISRQATHIFVADDIYDIQGGYDFVATQLIPRIVSNHSTEDKIEKLFVFSVDGNQLKIEKFNVDKQ